MITNVQLTTKEKFLLEDARTHEEQCILKYGNYSKLAVDKQLKSLFSNLQQKEKEHLQTVNELLSGKVPSMSGGQSGGQGSMGKSSGQQASASADAQQASVNQASNGSNIFQASDKDLCTDMLDTEKYVSGTYNTAIFEFKDAPVRDVLNHIQTEEQKHGEALFAYMQSKGMYAPK
ncbi:MAG TPA: spore coat protein [Clostridiales bacterium]|nr:spore coat protein [Clostridiales bacterium]